MLQSTYVAFYICSILICRHCRDPQHSAISLEHYMLNVLSPDKSRGEKVLQSTYVGNRSAELPALLFRDGQVGG